MDPSVGRTIYVGLYFHCECIEEGSVQPINLGVQQDKCEQQTKLYR